VIELLKSFGKHKCLDERSLAKQARLKLEAETGKKLVSPQNAKELQLSTQTKSKKGR